MKNLWLKLLIIGVIVVVVVGVALYFVIHKDDISSTDVVDSVCNGTINSDLAAEIAAYQTIVDQIVTAMETSAFKNKTWLELANFTDTFGNRLAGSVNLENAIDYVLDLLENSYGLDNVHGENVTVPYWVRGNEYCQLVSPKNLSLNILGLGYSVNTSADGITADVLVVQSFDELELRASEAVGKIVVIAEEWLGSYGATVSYRTQAAIKVAKVGGVAALIRSITPFSINSPHTGMMDYETNVTKIPAAALTVEDAQMLLRMSQRGTPLTIKLYMEAQTLPDRISRNTVAELTGTTYPEKVVIVSGHLDSWDVGKGAMDDGGGAFMSWGALALLKSLGLQPKRTIRAVLWTAEEEGYYGAEGYAAAHANETDNFIAMLESDEGTFTPLGLQYGGSDVGGCVIKEILKLMTPISATEFENSSASDVGSDINVWADKVPLLANLNDNGKYFWFHHSDADTMTVIDPDDLDKNVALWAATAYILADLSVDLPKPNATSIS